MTLRLKVAGAAALLMSVVAAFAATDATLAAGMTAAIDLAGTPADAAHGALPDSTAHSLAEAQAPTAAPAVTYATPRPLVQPLAAPADDADSLAELVSTQDMPDTLDAETRCLAGAIFFEAKSESLEGQLAVARVVINRRDSGRFADSLCGVVYQPSQFSFVRGRAMPAIDTGSRDWREAVAVARIALADGWDTPAEGALYFHARRVSPGWGSARMAAIGNHIFYR